MKLSTHIVLDKEYNKDILDKTIAEMNQGALMLNVQLCDDQYLTFAVSTLMKNRRQLRENYELAFDVLAYYQQFFTVLYQQKKAAGLTRT